MGTSTNLDRTFWCYVGAKITRVKVGFKRTYEENGLAESTLFLTSGELKAPTVGRKSKKRIMSDLR